ncbi:hypothetical protein J7I98_35575 [Streptomyces sp. ISL-98]|uniref:hypothetical protein n=1 Tax=Streptomyces sp. ISL-98 TaxID=2819192 RepID=UPI001BE7B40D|nr:hypothetical protein [Streptomyces sp. ISL-98]MBT2511052.1 hypothetical protein [Streptomyces sp. ISL-98]
MKYIVAGHVAVTATEFVELALGTPLELWLGVEGESEMERVAREDAARDILAAYPELVDTVSRVAAEAIESFAPDLFQVSVLPRPARRRRQAASGKQVAA